MRDPDFKGIVPPSFPVEEGPALVEVKAWRSKAEPVKPDHEGTLAAWVLNGPFHLFWKWWVIAVIHLRPIEGVRPAGKQYPEAEHELLIVSLNPEYPDPDPDEAGTLHHLYPPDLAYQFHGLRDDQAVEIGELCVRRCVSGEMSPDSDYRAIWKDRLDTTVQHYREGRH